MYILITIFHVNSGATLNHIEFNTKGQCIAVRNWLLDNSKSHGYNGDLLLADCVPKGFT